MEWLLGGIRPSNLKVQRGIMKFEGNTIGEIIEKMYTVEPIAVLEWFEAFEDYEEYRKKNPKPIKQ